MGDPAKKADDNENGDNEPVPPEELQEPLQVQWLFAHCHSATAPSNRRGSCSPRLSTHFIMTMYSSTRWSRGVFITRLAATLGAPGNRGARRFDPILN